MIGEYPFGGRRWHLTAEIWGGCSSMTSTKRRWRAGGAKHLKSDWSGSPTPKNAAAAGVLYEVKVGGIGGLVNQVSKHLLGLCVCVEALLPKPGVNTFIDIALQHRHDERAAFSGGGVRGVFGFQLKQPDRRDQIDSEGLGVIVGKLFKHWLQTQAWRSSRNDSCLSLRRQDRSNPRWLRVGSSRCTQRQASFVPPALTS